MKKINILLILIVLLLTACSEASAQTTEASSGQEVSDATVVESSLVTDNTSSDPTTEPEGDKTLSILPTDYENAASVETQLLIGIYQLNGTDLAVTAEQASSLIELLTTLQDSFTSQDLLKKDRKEMRSLLRMEVRTILRKRSYQLLPMPSPCYLMNKSHPSLPCRSLKKQP